MSSDSHTWNLVFLQLILEEHGYTVTNLGPCVPDEVLLRAARDEQPDAVIISSVNGHGHLDGARVIRALRRDDRTRLLPVMIGGKLGIRGNDNDGYAGPLIAAGFDAVFTDSTDVAALPRFLAALPDRDRSGVNRSDRDRSEVNRLPLRESGPRAIGAGRAEVEASGRIG